MAWHPSKQGENKKNMWGPHVIHMNNIKEKLLPHLSPKHTAATGTFLSIPSFSREEKGGGG
jgi:hypothetical protein